MPPLPSPRSITRHDLTCGPRLTVQELHLAVAAAKAGDRDAADRVVRSVSRFVYRIVDRWPVCVRDELLAAALAAVWNAVLHFDESRGVRFITYVGTAVSRTVWREFATVRCRTVGACQRLPPPVSLSRVVDLPVAVQRTMEAALCDYSANGLVRLLEKERRQQIALVFWQLRKHKPRAYRVLRRQLRGDTLRDIAKDYDITRQRVQQMSAGALQWIANFVRTGRVPGESERVAVAACRAERAAHRAARQARKLRSKSRKYIAKRHRKRKENVCQ